MAGIRCVLGDASAVMIEGFTAVLGTEGVKVVAGAPNPDVLRHTLERMHPDVAVVGFAEDDVVDLAERETGIPVVWLTDGLAPRSIVHRAFDAGVRAVVPKSAPVTTVVDAIRAAAAGQLLYRGAWQPTVVDLRERAAARRAPPEALRLTEREHELIQLVVEGKTNREVADALGIAEQTTKNHLRTLFIKAGVANRAQLAVWAMGRGFRPAETVSGPGGPPGPGAGR